MAILKVAQIGHPTLRLSATPVALERLESPEFQRLVDDLSDTMREYAGVGLAAPQVRESMRVFVMEIGRSERYPERQPFELLAVINPVVTQLGAERIDGWEGCLSIAGMRGLVPRSPAIRLRGLDRFGDEIDLQLEGFAAVVAQHESDHLDGVLYVDRMPDLTTLMAEEEYQRMTAASEHARTASAETSPLDAAEPNGDGRPHDAREERGT
jgi:peptide deformylase